ncbi:hypothetical protein [Rhodopirellula halodulae]|uniref:hypothetical protein n=1 Tax=Rhodopirellula halodulae TaxID=2894198 RepID=UPI001E509E76|nr:hypothetical protein [Rhodopirellula sp. JC737]MCC9656411.1 hypothetical protein [Rhodopirellula sp. JC737]
MLGKLLFAIMVFCTPAIVSAQQQSPDLGSKSEAMKKLKFLTGVWEGEGSIEFGGRRSKFHGRETVELKIGGLALLIEGVHKMNLPNGEERVIHNALGLITYNPESKDFQFIAHLSNGRSGTYKAMLTDENTLQWTLSDSPVGKMRYTINVNDGKWHEIGEISEDGKGWVPFFEMQLSKVDRE